MMMKIIWLLIFILWGVGNLVLGRGISARELSFRDSVGPFIPDVSIHEVMANRRQSSHQHPPKEHVTEFVKRLQNLLSRLIPSKLLIEDIMGYVSSTQDKRPPMRPQVDPSKFKY